MAAHDVVLTVRKTADVHGAFDCAAVRELHGAGHVQSTGMVVYHLVDDVAEGYLELTDRLNDRIDALEDHVADDWASARLSSLSRRRSAPDCAVVGGPGPNIPAVAAAVDTQQPAAGHDARAVLRPRLRLHDHAADDGAVEAPNGRGLLRVVVMLGVIWWMYGGYAWMTNAVSDHTTARRLVLLAAMGAYFVLALSIPDAFGGTGSRSASRTSASSCSTARCSRARRSRAQSERCSRSRRTTSSRRWSSSWAALARRGRLSTCSGARPGSCRVAARRAFRRRGGFLVAPRTSSSATAWS